jgi:c-di-GMP-related signal transduction protein
MKEKFIARQPVFDRNLKVFAYELLFRGGPQNLFVPTKNAATSVIVDSTMLFDLQTLTGPAKAFINMDDASLHSRAAFLLPPDRIVIELLEGIVPNDACVEACRELRDAGYTLALDDFKDHPKWAPLIELVSFLKVDFRSSGIDERRAIAGRYARTEIQLVAEKVETEEELKNARSLGYCYFQGYFFCKPAMVAAREIPGSKLNYIRLLERAAAPEISFPEVEELLKQDPSLTYKLLRYLNSPVVGIRGEVHSVREAIALIGENEFRRWVRIVAVVAMAGDKPPELIRTALTRAYFCEEMSKPLGLPQESSDLFLMGLLSVTDAILNTPIERVLEKLPVAEKVRSALCGGENRYRDLYEALLAYERADWKHLTTKTASIGAQEDSVPGCYLAAANRANATHF